MTEIDPRLRTELGHRAGQIEVTGDFAARAIEIEHRAHRRRVATATLGSALTLAVTAPLVYSAMTPESPQPLPAASSTTAPVPAPTSSAPIPTTSAPAPTPTAIPTFDIGAQPLATVLPTLGPATATPDVPYAVDGVLHDGTRQVPLPAKTGIWQLAPLDHGGALVSVSTETGGGTSIVDATGEELASLAFEKVVVSEEGDRLFASDPVGVLKVLDSRGRTIIEKRTRHMPTALMDDLAFANAVEGSDSIVWNIATGKTSPIKGMVVDVNAQRRIAVVMEPEDIADPGQLCYSILDVDSLTTQSRACGPLAPVRLSPRGGYLIATGTFDGGGPISLAVIRVDDGRIALKIDDSIGAWTATMNEAETAVVFSASEAGPTAPTNNALVRCELTGDCSVVGESRTMPVVAGMTASVWTVPDR